MYRLPPRPVTLLPERPLSPVSEPAVCHNRTALSAQERPNHGFFGGCARIAEQDFTPES